MKTCKKCTTDYPEPIEKYFSKKKGTKDGLQGHCKVCMAKFLKTHYGNNPDYYKDKAKKSNKEYRDRNSQYMIDYLKQHPCIDCGEPDPIVLDFDHRSDKLYNVSEMKAYPLQRVISEIGKCDVRCANCHRRKTAKERDFYKNVTL